MGANLMPGSVEMTREWEVPSCNSRKHVRSPSLQTGGLRSRRLPESQVTCWLPFLGGIYYGAQPLVTASNHCAESIWRCTIILTVVWTVLPSCGTIHGPSVPFLCVCEIMKTPSFHHHLRAGENSNRSACQRQSEPVFFSCLLRLIEKCWKQSDDLITIRLSWWFLFFFSFFSFW